MGMFSEVRAVPKPDHGRRNPKRKEQGNFSKRILGEIYVRDEGRCVRCGSYALDTWPHHVEYRSSLGKGTKRNGVCICRDCHNWAHASKKKNNIWFVEWVELNLDEEGNLKHNPPLRPGIIYKNIGEKS